VMDAIKKAVGAKDMGAKVDALLNVTTVEALAKLGKDKLKEYIREVLECFRVAGPSNTNKEHSAPK